MSSAASALVGSEDFRLIIIRGNYGSEKSSLAKAIRGQLGHSASRSEPPRAWCRL